MYDISLKRKWDAEAVRMYQEGLEEQLKAATKAVRDAEKVAVVAKAEGLAEGERKKALATALKLKEMGIPLDIIATGTGLTIEEVENLK